MKKIHPIKGAVQNYAWGGDSYIPKLLRIENADNQPFAEIWLGAHQRGPATLIDNGESISLNQWIAKNQDALGEMVVEKFGNRLPYLFKVLDVNKMLSIQSHPTKKAAEIGFERENKAGISLTARDRNYKDDNHKPEVMIAMTDFWLLHGFKSADEIEAVLNEYSEFEPLRKYFVEKDIYHLYKTIMEMSQEEVDEILLPLKENLNRAFRRNQLLKSRPSYWAALAFRDMELEGGHCDRGIFSIYLFNLVGLKKGEGIFQDAGIPHAYLEGVNMELMANSDNVFRGGLTVKHIDVKELLEHLVFEPVVPNILKGEEIQKGVKVFKTPAPDFELTQIELKDFQDYEAKEVVTPETLIVMKGEVMVDNGDEEYRMSRGDAFFVPAGASYSMISEGKAEIYKAAVPVSVSYTHLTLPTTPYV